MRRAAACLSAVLLAAACQPPAAVTFEDGQERLPSAGYLHVEGDPIIAERATEVRFVGSDGAESAVAVRFAAGDRIVIDHSGFPGEHWLTVGGVLCRGPFTLFAEQETDLVLHLSLDGCLVTTSATHAVGSRSHEPGVVP